LDKPVANDYLTVAVGAYIIALNNWQRGFERLSFG